jgi:hypothetical protein
MSSLGRPATSLLSQQSMSLPCGPAPLRQPEWPWRLCDCVAHSPKQCPEMFNVLSRGLNKGHT